MPPPLIAFLATAFTCLLASVAAFVLAVREPGLKLKPIWALLSLVGMGGGVMIWAVPTQIHWFFGIALPTASFVGGEGGWPPTLVRFLFPVGALVVFARLYWHRHGGRKGVISV